MLQQFESENNTCSIHQQEALFLNQNFKDLNERYPCQECCINHLTRTQENRDNVNNKQQVIQSIKMNIQFIQMLSKMIDFLEGKIMSIIKSLRLQIVEASNQLLNYEQIILSPAVGQVAKNFLTQVQMKNEKILQDIHDFQEISNLNQIEKVCSFTNQKIKNDIEKFIKQISENLQFKIAPYTSISHDKKCKAITSNKNTSVIAAGYDNAIKIYEIIKETNYQEIQLLEHHKKTVSYLQFMSNKSLISGGDEGYIVIWQLLRFQFWAIQQAIEDHQYSITCIRLNQEISLMVSSGMDCTVRFWKNEKQWVKQQEEIVTSSPVIQFNFFKDWTKIFLCEAKNFVWIVGIQEGLWKQIERIDVGLSGIQFSLGMNYFSIIPSTTLNLNVFQRLQNSDYKQILKIGIYSSQKETTCIHLKKIKQQNDKIYLFSLVGKWMQILSTYQQNAEFQIEQTIQLEFDPDYGKLSDDKKLILLWHKTSKNLVIMKVQDNL